MIFRRAVPADIPQITAIYDHIHDAEEVGQASVGWARNVYPTRQTAEEAVASGDMFVGEEAGHILAAGRINHDQLPEYAAADWLYDAAADAVMVLHTLVVDPQRKGKGCGAAFVRFYEEYAAAQGCPYLRIDTQEKNVAARAFYGKLGFREAGVIGCTFNGIPDVRLVCLEKHV